LHIARMIRIPALERRDVIDRIPRTLTCPLGKVISRRQDYTARS
jgi:hypothetical protein